MLKRYSYADTMAIKNHFQYKLGEAGFGSVYKGKLPSGCLIAIKRLGKYKFNGEEFINEVSTIGRIHHVNVARLLGFCSKESKRALVYEYIPNRSLDKHIFLKQVEIPSFGWEKLLEIALRTTREIEYLHGGVTFALFILISSLLYHDFVLEISYLGLAKLYPKEYDIM